MSKYITIGMDLGNKKHAACALDPRCSHLADRFFPFPAWRFAEKTFALPARGSEKEYPAHSPVPPEPRNPAFHGAETLRDTPRAWQAGPRGMPRPLAAGWRVRYVTAGLPSS